MSPELGHCIVLLLAAGRGLRMGDLTREVPKALISVDGERSILDINLEHIRLSIADPHVTVVGGHGWDRLHSYCKRRDLPLPLQAVLNPDFATAGPARSILAGLDPGRPPADLLLVANGDTLFSAAMIAAAARVKEGCCLLVSHTHHVAADDLLVSLDDTGKIMAAAKGGSFHGVGLISSGLLAVRGPQARAAFMAALEEVCTSEQSSGRFLPWHATMARMAARGVPAAAHCVDRGHWAEFDTTSCIERYQSTPRGQEAAETAASFPI